MSDTYLKVAEIAAYLGKSEQTVRRLIKTGDIPTHKIRTPQGYQYLAKMQDLQQLLQSTTKKPEAKKTRPSPQTEVFSQEENSGQESLLLNYKLPLEVWEISKDIEESFIGQEAHFFYPEAEEDPKEKIQLLEQKIRDLETQLEQGKKEVFVKHYFIAGQAQEIHWYVCSPAYKAPLWALDFQPPLD